MRVTQQQQAARSGSSCVASRTQAPAAALRARRANGFTACATRRNMYQDLAYTPTTESFDGGLDFEYDTALPGTGFLVAPPGGYPQQGGYQQQGGYPMQGGYQNNRGAGYPSNLGGYRQAPRFQQQQQLQPVQPMQDFWQDDEEDLDDYAGDLAPPEDKSVQQRTVNGKQLLINQEIKAAQVRVIGGEGGKTQRGIMSFRDAMMLANDMQVDLVLLNDQVDPPLCRLVSWSKYKYEIEKDQKKKASKSSNVETKEVRLRPGTDSNDLTTKLKSATKFLEKGNKVQLVMKFQGRELQFKEQGKQVMLKFVDDLNGCGKVDGPINFKTGTFTAMLSPIARGGAGAAVKAPAPEPTKPAAAAAQLPLPPSLPPTPPVLGNGSLPLPPPLPAVPTPAAAPAAPAPAVPPAAPPAAPGRVAPVGVPTPAPLPMPPARPAAPAPAGLPLSPTIPTPGPRPMAPPPLQRPGLAPPPMMVPQRPVGAPAPALNRPGPVPSPQRPAQQPLQQPQRMPMPATAH